jgi:phage FluMu protein Com
MICIFCKTTFRPKVLRTIDPKPGDGIDIEVHTRCPKCKEVYYTFTDGNWTSLKRSNALFAKSNKGAQ